MPDPPPINATSSNSFATTDRRPSREKKKREGKGSAENERKILFFLSFLFYYGLIDGEGGRGWEWEWRGWFSGANVPL